MKREAQGTNKLFYFCGKNIKSNHFGDPFFFMKEGNGQGIPLVESTKNVPRYPGKIIGIYLDSTNFSLTKNV